ncbi:MAG: triacylglycerol lipase [Planctomycetaceae bacterium]
MLRHYLSENDIENLGRSVMLGPPNKGSMLADYIKTIGFANKMQPPAGRELGADDDSIAKNLGPVSFDVGVIAGNKNVRPLVSKALLGPSDGTVTVA